MNSWLKNFAFWKRKGYFFAPNVRGKGVFSKMENADMSSIIVLSEGAGTPTWVRSACVRLYRVPHITWTKDLSYSSLFAWTKKDYQPPSLLICNLRPVWMGYWNRVINHSRPPRSYETGRQYHVRSTSHPGPVTAFTWTMKDYQSPPPFLHVIYGLCRWVAGESRVINQSP